MQTGHNPMAIIDNGVVKQSVFNQGQSIAQISNRKDIHVSLPDSI